MNKIYTPLALINYYYRRGEGSFYYNLLISQGVYSSKLLLK